MIGTSFLVVALLTIKGEMIAHMPITIPMLLMLLPTTLPKIRSVCKPTAAATLAASSGVDVPYATIVKPITIWLILSFLAMDTPPLTNQFPPKHSIARPTTVSNALMAIST